MSSSENRSMASLAATRSIRASLVSTALLALGSSLNASGALPAVSLVIAASAIYSLFGKLPETLVGAAARRRGGSYLRLMSLIVPGGTLLVSAYLTALFIILLQSDLPLGIPLEISIALFALSGLLSLVVAAVNLISPEVG